MAEGPGLKRFLPFLQWGPLVNRQSIRDDFMAGVTGAIIVLPQGIAFALIAGLPPVYGLYTAMVTPIVAALFGSSRHLISGPTTALSIALFSSIRPYAEPYTEDFIALALILTFLTGTIQFLLGVVRLGTLVNFVSHSVVWGFTAGAAILIATSQLKYLLGMEVPSGHSFLNTLQYIFSHGDQIQSPPLILGTVTLLVAFLLKKFLPKAPNLLIALLLGTFLAYYFSGFLGDVKKVGEMPKGFPPFHFHDFNPLTLQMLIPSAATLALLGLIEAVAIARSISVRTNQPIDGNQEFIGQGLSNMLGSFFSCYVGSGSFTRSGVNFSAGAKTPMAAIFAALLLMLILFFAAPLAAFIPIPTMGGIIMLVAYNLIDFKHIREIIVTSKSETAVLVITFLSTLFIQLEFAIYSGVISSLLFYLLKTSKPRIVRLAPDSRDEKRKFLNSELYELKECPQLHIIRIDGSLFFGAIEYLRNSIFTLSREKKNILLLGSGINFIDAEGADLLVREANRLRENGGNLFLCNLKKPERDFLNRGAADKIGKDHLYNRKEEALLSIIKKLDIQTCQSCTLKIFRECPSNLKP